MIIENLSEELGSFCKVSGVAISTDGSSYESESVIVNEHNVDLIVNGVLFAKLVCTPSDLVQMIVGRLITEGIVKNTDDIATILISADGGTVRVQLKSEVPFVSHIEKDMTSCPGNKVLMMAPAGEILNKLENTGDGQINRQWIFALANEFAAGSKIHKTTKGTHSCYLGVKGQVVYVSEDIGRHNALDKAVGYSAMNGLNPGECILFTTGRVPTDMVKKAIMARVPVLVSKAVPTMEAVLMAKEYGLTLICKAWPDKFEIFA